MPELLAQEVTGAEARDESVPRGAGIAAVGMAVPERVVTNAPIARRLGIDEEWIARRTGVRERRIAEADETLADLAARAGTRALERARVPAAEVDLVLVATM